MYSNPIYYLLLAVSFFIFIIYIYAVFKSKKIELVEMSILDNNAYWVYNNKLYNAKFVENSLDNKTVSKVETFGMNAEEAYKVIKEVL